MHQLQQQQVQHSNKMDIELSMIQRTAPVVTFQDTGDFDFDTTKKIRHYSKGRTYVITMQWESQKHLQATISADIYNKNLTHKFLKSWGRMSYADIHSIFKLLMQGCITQTLAR